MVQKFDYVEKNIERGQKNFELADGLGTTHF